MNDHLTTETLIDFLHGELPAAEDARAHAHLAVCSVCRAERELEALVGESLRAAAASEERAMPSLVSAAVWQRIRDARPGPFARLAAVLRPVVAVPVAAALVLGALFASPLIHSAAAPKIDATYYLQAHAAQAGLTPLSEHSGAQALETSMIDSSSAAPTLLGRHEEYAAAGMLDAVH
jgi:anti-sigma factor RsiW